MKTLKLFAVLMLLALTVNSSSGQNVLLELYTPGVQYGNVNLDHLWVASAPDNNAIIMNLPMENYDSLSVGAIGYRSNAMGQLVVTEFGCTSYNPWFPKAGSAFYSFPFPGLNSVFFKFRYSKDWTFEDSISIFIDDKKVGAWMPQITGDWNSFISTDFIEIELPPIPIINAGPDETICIGESQTLADATASNYNTLLWTTTGDGSFNNTAILNPVYTPGDEDIESATVVLCLTAISADGLYQVSDCLDLTILSGPLVYAGVDAYLRGESYFLETASASFYETLQWYSNENGSFNDPTSLNPTYTPDTYEPGTQITLCLEAAPISPCLTSSSDCMILKIPFDCAYSHPFQNWDDDIDRIKNYSNLWSGDYGITWDTTESLEPQFEIDLDPTTTRTGFGRSLRFNYGPLNDWTMYVESFSKRWHDTSEYFNLYNLFPDFTDGAFQSRQIDSIVFHCKLDAAYSLNLKIELHDIQENSSEYIIIVPASSTWHRFAIGLDQFDGEFNRAKAKFIGFVIADYPGNMNESGTLWLDDILMVENYYSKPVFDDEDEFLQYVNKVNFRHFWEAVDPVSKFALDRHSWADLISVDAIGFQLTAYAIAHKNNWIDPQLIEDRVEHILDYLANTCQHGTDEQVQANPLQYATVNGNWAHFLDYQTLARKGISTEFSLFSNALLLSGVYVAKEYFTANANIKTYAESLINLTDWNFLYREQDSLMYFAWKPESGYCEYYTNWFTEELDLSFLLAISSPNPAHRLPVNPFISPGYYKPCCSLYPNTPYVYSAPGSNFTYYFLQMYADYTENKFEISRFQNARNALLADKAFCNKEYAYLGYDERIFGTTACEGPDSTGQTPFGNNLSNYHAYGYPCRFDDVNVPNGTVAVYGTASPILFTPEETIAGLDYYYNELDSVFMADYAYNFWSPIFGFPDAFHLAPDESKDPDVNDLGFNGPWLSVPRFSIDIGPMLMNIDSYLSEKEGSLSIRSLFTSEETISPHIEEFTPLECTNVDFQNFDIKKGWSGISSWLIPHNGNVEVMFDPILPELIILQNASGLFFWPGQNINTLGTWNTREGYQVKVADNVLLTITGTKDPNRTLQLATGWNLIPIISECDVNVTSLFEGTDVVITKEVAGWNIYWPAFGINSLGILKPGKAYFVLMNSEAEIIFPECAPMMTPSPTHYLEGKGADPDSNHHKDKMGTQYKKSNFQRNVAATCAGTPSPQGEGWGEVTQTASSHTIALPKETVTNLQIPTGSLIQARDETGNYFGVGICQDQNTSITLFGDDPLTESKDGFYEDDEIIFKLISNGDVTQLQVEYDQLLPNADGLFHTNGLSAIKAIELGSTGLENLSQSSFDVFPNPADEVLNVTKSFVGKADLSIISIQGTIVFVSEFDGMSFEVDIKSLQAGIYFIELKSEQANAVKKVVVE